MRVLTGAALLALALSSTGAFASSHAESPLPRGGSHARPAAEAGLTASLLAWILGPDATPLTPAEPPVATVTVRRPGYVAPTR